MISKNALPVVVYAAAVLPVALILIDRIYYMYLAIVKVAGRVVAAVEVVVVEVEVVVANKDKEQIYQKYLSSHANSKDYLHYFYFCFYGAII